MNDNHDKSWETNLLFLSKSGELFLVVVTVVTATMDWLLPKFGCGDAVCCSRNEHLGEHKHKEGGLGLSDRNDSRQHEEDRSAHIGQLESEQEEQRLKEELHRQTMQAPTVRVVINIDASRFLMVITACFLMHMAGTDRV